MRLILLCLIPIAYIAGTHTAQTSEHSEAFYRQAVLEAYNQGRQSVIEDVVYIDDQHIEVASK